MGSPYPAGGYRSGASGRTGTGLSNVPGNLLEQVLRQATQDAALREVLKETARREASRGRSAVPDAPLKGKSGRALQRLLNGMHPIKRAAALAQLLVGLLSEQGRVLNYPGFHLKDKCGPWGFPYTDVIKFRGHFPANSLGCISGQYPLAPADPGGAYTNQETQSGFALWCDRYDAPIDPRCATMEIWAPNTSPPPVEGASPFSSLASDAAKQTSKLPVPWDQQPERTPENSPHQERGPEVNEEMQTGQAPQIQPAPMPRPQPQPQPAPWPAIPVVWERPGPGTREKKGIKGRVIHALLGNLTEGIDILNSAYDSLPCEVRAQYQFKGRKKPVSVREKKEAVWKNFKSMDMERLGFNLVSEAVADAAYAVAGKPGQIAAFTGSGRQLTPTQQGEQDAQALGQLPTGEVKEFLWQLAKGKPWPKPKKGKCP